MAKQKKKLLKKTLRIRGFGNLPAGTEVTDEMEKAFEAAQKEVFDVKDPRNKGVKLPKLSDYYLEVEEGETVEEAVKAKSSKESEEAKVKKAAKAL